MNYFLRLIVFMFILRLMLYPLLHFCFFPTTSALERARSFLPQLVAANSELEKKIKDDPESCNIENVDDCTGPIIEMVHIVCVKCAVCNLSTSDCF